MTDTTGLLAAMLAVQAEAPTLTKDRTVTVKTKTGGEFTYSYTPLDTIVEQVGPLLHKNGLVWSTKPSWHEKMGPTLKYKIAHAPTGESDEGEMPLMLAEEDAQGMGSAITYMRRYALCAVLNLVADADDDGALAGANRGRAGGSGGRPASEKQLEYLRSLLKKKKLTVAAIRQLLLIVGVTVPDGADVVQAVDALTGPQASAAIERLKDGPALTGESDVPSAGPDEFTHPLESADTGDVFHHENGDDR